MLGLLKFINTSSHFENSRIEYLKTRLKFVFAFKIGGDYDFDKSLIVLKAK
jgi:hypothetical protein